MATVDMTLLNVPFNIAAVTVDQVGVPVVTANSFTWFTAAIVPRFRVTALSSSGDIVAGTPPVGTIDAILIHREAAAGVFTLAVTITGLNVPIGSLIDTATPANTSELFWETILAGDSTIIAPTTSGSFLLGDFDNVGPATSATGGNDEIIGNGTGFVAIAASGDANAVAVGATLTGGNDLIDGYLANNIFGDAVNSAGTVIGGDDTIRIVIPVATPAFVLIGTVSGEAGGSTGTLTGGDDIIHLVNLQEVGGVMGDADIVSNGTVAGGNDTITVERDASLPLMILGDELIAGDVVEVASFATSAVGGDDTMTLRNITGELRDIAGDFVSSGAAITAGDDTILIENTTALDAVFSRISGDAVELLQGGTFGDDLITVKDTRFAQLAGDASVVSGGNVVAGNDTITMTYDLTANFLISNSVFGDGVFTGGANATFGDDTITITLGTGVTGSFEVLGDGNWSGTGTGAGGNDVIIVNAEAALSLLLKGDFDTTPASGTFSCGNDSVTGGKGNDLIVGDGRGITIGGGSDTLDGRQGDDVLDGNGGNDTALFSLALGVTVNLNGIAGVDTGNPLDPVEAIGQGFDQLIDIENVTGSSKGDTITGNAQINVLRGEGGDDTLKGGGGNDILNGGIGNDTLDGGADNDSMIGGNGNDTYIVDSAADSVIETNATASGGVDRMVASVTRTLDANIEQLFLFGTATVNSTGNELGNVMFGNSATNILSGLDGNDQLNGAGGNDILSGGLGNDTLTGAAGLDAFLFNTAPNTSTNRDTITDFVAADDTIRLENAVFTAAGAAGALVAGAFKANASGIATEADDRIVYNQLTGALLYDADGNGAGVAVQFATLSTKPNISAADFLIV